MTQAIRTPKSQTPPQPRVQRGAAAVVAQYVHELAAAARTSSAVPRPTTLGHCWGCA
jgi:hypothetical protein